jgi:hypothetical protein
MPHGVLQFWLSLDGCSCDEGTEPFRVTREIDDDEQEEHLVNRLRQAGTPGEPQWRGCCPRVRGGGGCGSGAVRRRAGAG